jgi:phage tail-like protein
MSDSGDGTNEWWPIEHGNMPAFQVKRPSYGSSIGGDFVRGSGTPDPSATLQKLPNAVLKYQTDDTSRRSAVAGQALLYVQPAGYDSVRIEWDWPVEEGQLQNWGEVALVRSQFGIPTTPNDGQVVFRSLREVWENADGSLMVGPVIFDNDLPGGNWFYYSLFFNISPQAPDLGDWVVGYSDSAQVPKRFLHDEHLFNGVPPYYQWIDENNRRKDGNGFLKQFLNIFGFELDYTRQSVEFMQDMYHTDITPIPLLRQLGLNLGAVEEQGLGDIRFRAMMSDLAQRLAIRGTQKGLQQTIETVSKYDTEITTGRNMMLLPDDSAPFFSSGNWAGPHPDLKPSLPPVVDWNHTTLVVHPADTDIPNVGMTGFIRITSSEVGDTMVTCGCGWIAPAVLTLPEGAINEPGEYIPLVNGIPVEETGVYGFSAYLRTSVTSQQPVLLMLWFDGTGKASNLISITEGIPPAGGSTTGWDARHVVQDIAPTGAVYLVPAVYTTARPDTQAYVDMTAAMVYVIQEPGSGFTVTPPDHLLTLGDPNEKIGAPPDPGDDTFPGYVMGSPAEKNTRMV